MLPLIDAYFRFQKRKKSFIKQPSLLFGGVVAFMILWSYSFGHFGHFIWYTLLLTAPFLYVVSFIWIYIYSVAGRKLDKIGIRKMPSMILISSGLIFIVGGIILRGCYTTYLSQYGSTRIGFIEFLQLSKVSSHECAFSLAILVCSTIIASYIKLYLSNDKKELSEDILDEGMCR